ncbi:hypothetical protein BDV59DRAFT_70270 [Aspergillus ambiguus]|uniref:uncharacterized protein n=1 Tax=Aspergillus ambiguus TaxID=176160 RepID=UPI003CCDB4F2
MGDRPVVEAATQGSLTSASDRRSHVPWVVLAFGPTVDDGTESSSGPKIWVPSIADFWWDGLRMLSFACTEYGVVVCGRRRLAQIVCEALIDSSCSLSNLWRSHSHAQPQTPRLAESGGSTGGMTSSRTRRDLKINLFDFRLISWPANQAWLTACCQ